MIQTRNESFDAMQQSGAIGCQNERIVHFLQEKYPQAFHAADVAIALNMRLTSARARLTTLVQSGAVHEGEPVLCVESNRRVTTYSLNSGCQPCTRNSN